MSRPKFQVGEEVILASKQRPEFNGEYVVIAVVNDGDIYKGIGFFNTDGRPYGYDLGHHIIADGKHPNIWSECALRKKHKPASKGFRALMRDLLKAPATMG